MARVYLQLRGDVARAVGAGPRDRGNGCSGWRVRVPLEVLVRGRFHRKLLTWSVDDEDEIHMAIEDAITYGQSTLVDETVHASETDYYEEVTS